MLPFKSAVYWLCGLLVITVLAFWPQYFSNLTTARPAVHFHTATALLWMGLLLWQSVSIHQGWRRLHRVAGLFSLVVAPLFIAGGFWVIKTGNASVTPFAEAVGFRAALLDVLSILGFAWFYYRTLINRHDVTLHAGYMLATALFLIYPIGFRFLAFYVPGFEVKGPADFSKLADGIIISNVLTIVFSLVVASRAGRAGRPFLILAGLTAFMAVGFVTFTKSEAWQSGVILLGSWPTAAIVSLGLLTGGAAAFCGWTRLGHRSPTD